MPDIANARVVDSQWEMRISKICPICKWEQQEKVNLVAGQCKYGPNQNKLICANARVTSDSQWDKRNRIEKLNVEIVQDQEVQVDVQVEHNAQVDQGPATTNASKGVVILPWNHRAQVRRPPRQMAARG